MSDWSNKRKLVATIAAAAVAAAMEEGVFNKDSSPSSASSSLDEEMELASQLPPVNPRLQKSDVPWKVVGQHEGQSKNVTELLKDVRKEGTEFEKEETATEKVDDAAGGSAVKKGRGRPRKYHTEAEREEAKRRYRENHKSKASGSGAGTTNVGTASKETGDVVVASPEPKGKVVDELWEAVKRLQGEVQELRHKLQSKEDSDAAAAMVAQALPVTKKRKMAADGQAASKKKKVREAHTSGQVIDS